MFLALSHNALKLACKVVSIGSNHLAMWNLKFYQHSLQNCKFVPNCYSVGVDQFYSDANPHVDKFDNDIQNDVYATMVPNQIVAFS